MREDFHTVTVGAEHRRVEIRPAVVDKGVDDRLPVGIGVKQRDFLPLDDAILPLLYSHRNHHQGNPGCEVEINHC